MYKQYLFISLFILIVPHIHAEDANLSKMDENLTEIIKLTECNTTQPLDTNGSREEKRERPPEEFNLTLSKNFNMCKGNSKRGEEIFRKFLKKPCQTTPFKFANSYSQDEWEEIAESGRFRETLFQLCKDIREIYQDVWSPDLYQFSYEHASDS